MECRLEFCQGPECPYCGCNQAEIVREPRPDDGEGFWWTKRGRAVCAFCHKPFAFRAVAVAIPLPSEPTAPPAPPAPPAAKRAERKVIPIVHCPDCGLRMPVIQTTAAFRRYQCKTCRKKARRARTADENDGARPPAAPE